MGAVESIRILPESIRNSLARTHHDVALRRFAVTGSGIAEEVPVPSPTVEQAESRSAFPVAGTVVRDDNITARDNCAQVEIVVLQIAQHEPFRLAGHNIAVFSYHNEVSAGSATITPGLPSP